MAGNSANSHLETRAQKERREPDALLKKMADDIHRNRERFSASAVNKAFAKARTTKVSLSRSSMKVRMTARCRPENTSRH
jgi:hypothetical protein